MDQKTKNANKRHNNCWQDKEDSKPQRICTSIGI